uniref:Uncharacterized protein n=1 Tax=Rhizophora mucronata TaxID=61149 RepID=A0A2P2LS20_RHIMU
MYETIIGKTLSITREIQRTMYRSKGEENRASILLNELGERSLNCCAPNMGENGSQTQPLEIRCKIPRPFVAHAHEIHYLRYISNHLQNERLNSIIKSILPTQPKLNGSLSLKTSPSQCQTRHNQAVTSHHAHQVQIDRPRSTITMGSKHAEPS